MSTGYYTGSFYSDSVLLYEGGFLGESLIWTDDRAVGIKVHKFGTLNSNARRLGFEPEVIVPKSVLLIRSPYRAILSEYNRERSHGHTSAVSKFDASDQRWSDFFEHYIKKWEISIKLWLSVYKGEVHILCYENVVENPVENVQNMLNFMGIHFNRPFCVKGNTEGNFKRKPSKVQYAKYFSEKHRELADNAIARIDHLLAAHGKPICGNYFDYYWDEPPKTTVPPDVEGVSQDLSISDLQSQMRHKTTKSTSKSHVAPPDHEDLKEALKDENEMGDNFLETEDELEHFEHDPESQNIKHKNVRIIHGRNETTFNPDFSVLNTDRPESNHPIDSVNNFRSQVNLEKSSFQHNIKHPKVADPNLFSSTKIFHNLPDLHQDNFIHLGDLDHDFELQKFTSSKLMQKIKDQSSLEVIPKKMSATSDFLKNSGSNMVASVSENYVYFLLLYTCVGFYIFLKFLRF